MKSAQWDGFARGLQQILLHDADRLLDQWLALIEHDIEDGWRAFYAREVWMREHLPAPLINGLGRALMVEQLRQKIRTNGEPLPADDLALLHTISQQEGTTDYRNYLQVGLLSLQERAAPLDLVADATAMRLLETAHRHAEFEIRRNQSNWYLQSTARCTLTPPLITVPSEGRPAVRDDSKPLALDTRYWWNLYEPDHRVALDCDNNGMFTPEVILALMADLAPDFPCATALSTAKRLVFMQTGDSALAWVIMIDKTDGGRTFRFPPALVLVDRALGNKLKDHHVLFRDVLTRHYYSDAISGQAAMELELRFHVTRLRRLIDVYRPYIEAALTAAQQALA